MALPTVGDASYPTPAQIRDTLLQAIVLSFTRAGLTTPNVLPGSDHYIRADRYANRISIAIGNNRAALSDMSPLTATGEALLTLASVFGITKRPASKAAGYVTITCTGTITIPASFQCTSPTGLHYQTTTIALGITTGAKVEVRAVTGGSDGNVDATTKVTWDSAAVGGLSQVATVSAGGITGGADEDSEEVIRQRLLDRLSFPLGGGNDAQTKAWAEEASAAVEKAYVYPGLRGAGSEDIAVTTAGGDRTLSDTNVGIVNGYVLAQIPGGCIDVNTTSVTPVYVDVVLYMTLPAPQNAGGAGGGWRDNSPFPSGTFTAGSDDGNVTAYNAGTGVATIRTTTAPVVGNQIAIWNYNAQAFDAYIITTVGGVSGAYTIKVKDGFKLDDTFTTPQGAYISTGAVNLDAYGSAFLAQVESLGPGEKTTNPDILARGRRHPGVDVSNPSDLTARLLSALTNGYEEVEDVSYAARFTTGTTTTITTPTVPATTTDPPGIFALRHFAIRKA